MADDDLILPTRKVLSLEDAKEAEKRPRRPGDKLQDYVTRGWALETFGKLATNLGQEMYTQVSGEIAEHLEGMEARLQQMVQRELYNRSFRGRLRAFLIRHGAQEKPPQLVHEEVTAALDPNIATAHVSAEEMDADRVSIAPERFGP